MPLLSFRPTTPSRRKAVLVDKTSLWKGGSEKSLTHGHAKSGGRNNKGRITSRHIGGGAKAKYRLIDFKRNKYLLPGKVQRIEYDPNRSAFIALIVYLDKTKSYIIAPQHLKVGDEICSSENADIVTGNTLPLSAIPTGTAIHNIEMKANKGGQIARSAGSCGVIMGRDGKYTLIKLPSGKTYCILSTCHATIGVVSNPEHKNIKLGKAGKARLLRRRPRVRGVAMNPIDHPHGGGEGRTSGGRHPVTPWGVPTKGKKTRKKNKASNKYIR